MIKAIKHSNLTIPMNNKKYKATTALTGEEFPPLSRHSTNKLNLKFLSITPPHKNALFSKLLARHMITAATTSPALKKPSHN